MKTNLSMFETLICFFIKILFIYLFDFFENVLFFSFNSFLQNLMLYILPIASFVVGPF